MKFLLIDIETTGLNEIEHQVLEVGVVLGDYTTPVENLPVNRWRFDWDPIIGHPFALNMNQQLIKDLISKPEIVDGHPTNYIEWERFPLELAHWIYKYVGDGKVTLAGKNVASFDLRFLRQNPNWHCVKYHHRIMDPAILFFDPETDKVLPDTAECLKRAGIQWDKSRLHNAIDDCKLVLELLRYYERTRKSLKTGQ